MRRTKLIMCVALISTMLCAVPVFASAKSISSVSIKISSELEAGDSLPTIQLSEDSSAKAEDGEVIVIVSNTDKYVATEAEWVTKNDDDEDLEVGDTPKLKVTLALANDDDYKWKSSYSSSNIKVSGGTYYKSSKSGSELTVTIKLKELKGTYGEPEDPHWSNYTAKWHSPDSNSSSRYEVKLKRDNHVVTTVKTDSTSYSFKNSFPKEGTYTFEVRSIPSESGKGTKSDWVESDEIDISEQEASNYSGSSSSSSSSQNGDSGTSSLSGPQSPMSYGWSRVNGVWFYTVNGVQTVGWQYINNNWYYFDTTGAMATGWRWVGDKWYYLTVDNSDDQGKMYHDRWLSIGDKEYYFGSSGTMLEGWQQINGNWYYFYPGYGHKAVNTVIDGYSIDIYGIWRG